MTHRDIYTKFMIEYDKANVTSSYPSLTPYEVATLLDKAYLALIARKITGNNPRRSQLESDIKSVSDLEPLIKTVDLSLSHVDRNISNYTLPNDFLYYVSSNMVYDAGTNTADGIQYRLLPVTITTHNVAERFFASLYNMPWVKNPVCYIEGGKAYLVYDPVDTPWTEGNNVASLTYIKSPAKFAGSSTFDPSNPPTYEPDPIDDVEYEDPTGGGQGLGLGQDGQLNPPSTDAYAISLSSLTKIEDNKYKCLATVTKNNVDIENPSIYWTLTGTGNEYITLQPNGIECIIIVNKTIPSNVVFYLNAKSNGKTGQQQVPNLVTYVTTQGWQNQSGVYIIEITDALLDTHYGNNTYFAECTVYKDGSRYKDGVTYWSLVDSSLESKILLEQSIDGRTCYFDVKSQLSNYNVLVKVTINGISQTKTLNLSTQSGQGRLQDPTGGQTITGRESIIVFDFLKPWNLNPSINVPQKPSPNTVEVMVTDKIFTNGPVLVYGVLAPDNQSSGDGCSILNLSKSDTYSYAVRAHSGINVKCSSGYYLKSIEFLGASGEFHSYDLGGYSTVNNIWKTSSQNITEVKFKTFRLPAYWWLIRVHVVNTGSGQAVDQSPERATLTAIGQDKYRAYFNLEYNDYLKQRCTSSLKSISVRREVSIANSDGTYGPWTSVGLSDGDAYNYKFIDDVGGKFLEYEYITNSKYASSTVTNGFKRLTPNRYRVRYVILRDSAWYGGYDTVLATTNAVIVPAEGETMYPKYVAPMLWFPNNTYVNQLNDGTGAVIVEGEFASSNYIGVMGPYCKYEIEDGLEYVTTELITPSGQVDREILGNKEAWALKIIPKKGIGTQSICVKIICSLDTSVSYPWYVDVTSDSSTRSSDGYDYTKLPLDAQRIDIDFTKPETLNFSPALVKSNGVWKVTLVSADGYVQHAGPNNMVSIVYRPKSGNPGDGVELTYTEQDGYYLFLKFWSGFVVTLNDSNYELYRIMFNGNTSVFNNANSVEKTWYANAPGIRENMQEVGYSTATMKKMTIIYRPTSNNDDYNWLYASYGTTWNGTVCPVFRKNYLTCSGTNFRLVDGTQYASIDNIGTIKIKNTPPYEFKFKVYFECEEDTSVNKTIEIPSYEITHASGGDPDPSVTPVEDPKDEFNITISYDSNKSTDNIAVIHLVMNNPDNLTSVRTRLQFKKADTSFPKGWVWSDLTSDFYFGKPDKYDYELRKNINSGIRYNNELTVRASTLANNLPASGHYSNEITIPTTS